MKVKQYKWHLCNEIGSYMTWIIIMFVLCLFFVIWLWTFTVAVSIIMIPHDSIIFTYCTILKYGIIIPLFSIDEIYILCCNACFDSFAEHAIHYRERWGFKYQNDMGRDILFYVSKCASFFLPKRDTCELFNLPVESNVNI